MTTHVKKISFWLATLWVVCLPQWVAGFSTNGFELDSLEIRIAQQLQQTMRQNRANRKNGTPEKNQYIIRVPSRENMYFYDYFNDQNAREIWFKLPFFGIIDDNHVLNKQILNYRETFLNKTEYKDYQIYFVVSAIHNYDNTEAADPDFTWNTARRTSYVNNVRPRQQAKYGLSFNEREKKIIGKVMQQVKTNNVLFTPYEDPTEKVIVCFFFNFYQVNPPNYKNVTKDVSAQADNVRVVTQYVTEVAAEVIPEIPARSIFMATGYESKNIDNSMIREIITYNQKLQTTSLTSANEDINTRNNRLTQTIRNLFLFFYEKHTGNVLNNACNLTDQVISDLYALYPKDSDGRLTDNTKILERLSLDGRKCIINKLTEQSFCTDAQSWLLYVNPCENILLDVIRTTPSSDRKDLLKTLQLSPLLRQLLTKINDAGAGEENLRNIVQVLSEFFYEVYPDKIQQALEQTMGGISFNAQDKADNGQYKNQSRYVSGNAFIHFISLDYYKDHFYLSSAQSGFIAPKDWNDDLLPFEPIVIMPTGKMLFDFKVSSGAYGGYLNQNICVPALLLHWNIKATLSQHAADKAWMAVNVASFFFGVAQLSTAAKFYRALAILDVISTSSIIMVDKSTPLGEALNQTEEGRKLVETVNTVAIATGVSIISVTLINSLRNSVKYWFANRGMYQTYPGYAALDARMERINQSGRYYYAEIWNAAESVDQLTSRLKEPYQRTFSWLVSMPDRVSVQGNQILYKGKNMEKAVPIAQISDDGTELIANSKSSIGVEDIETTGTDKSVRLDGDEVSDISIGCKNGDCGFIGLSCFIAGTPVWTQSGMKTIETVRSEDKVWCWNGSGYELQKVNYTFTRQSGKLLSIYSSGKLIASTTEEHPFYVVDTHSEAVASLSDSFLLKPSVTPFITGRYVAARKLKKGDQLLSRILPTVVIDSVVVKDTLVKVYNFEVAQWHNYLVGDQAVLVHNECGRPVITIGGQSRSIGSAQNGFVLLESEMKKLTVGAEAHLGFVNTGTKSYEDLVKIKRIENNVGPQPAYEFYFLSRQDGNPTYKRFRSLDDMDGQQIFISKPTESHIVSSFDIEEPIGTMYLCKNPQDGISYLVFRRDIISKKLWFQHQTKVTNYLKDNYDVVVSQVKIKITDATGSNVLGYIIPDNIYFDLNTQQWQIVDAKFSETKNLALETPTYTAPQRISYPLICNSNQKIRAFVETTDPYLMQIFNINSPLKKEVKEIKKGKSQLD